MLPSFFKNLGPISIDSIKCLIDCDLYNLQKSISFRDFVGINNIQSNSLSFLYDDKPIKFKLPENVVIICNLKTLKSNAKIKQAIIVKNVQEAVAKISNIFYRDLNYREIELLDKPVIGQNTSLHENAKIQNGAIVGNNVKIGSGVFIGHNCIIGNNSIIDANAVITNSILGDKVMIGRNTSIGQPGFGFYLNENLNIEIFHTGRVILKNNVRFGSGCSVDRGSFSDTVVGENTYFDNLCHIAHNVQIGANSTCCNDGIAGSTKIGNNVLAGGQVGIAGHLKIGNNVQIAAKSGVFNDLDNNQSVMGNPAINKFKFIRSYKRFYGK